MDSDLNTLLVFFKEAIDKLSSTIKDEGHSNNQRLIDELKKTRDKLDGISKEATKPQDTDTKVKPETQKVDVKIDQKQDRTFWSGVKDALLHPNRKAEQTMLEAMSKDKTLLQELATEQKKGTAEIVRGIKKSAEVFSKFGKDLMDQFSKGELRLGPLSAINNMILPNIDRYRSMTAQGQAFGGSIIQMRRTMNNSGQTLDQFSNLVTSGPQGTRMLGMDNLAKFSKTVIGANAALGDLGLSIDGVNEYMGSYLENLRLQGRLGTLNNEEMSKSYRQFVVDVTDIAHNLGISRAEATARLNEKAKDPETTFLAATGGLSAQQRTAFDTLQAQYGNSPMMRKVLRDAFLNTIMPGYGRSIDVNAALAGQPGGEQAWQGIVSGVRNAINNPSTVNAQAGLIGNSFNRLAGRPNQSQLGAFISGNLNGQDIRSTRNALDLKMEVLAANVKQIADNSNSAPTGAQLGGADPITRELSNVDKSAQNLANSFQKVQNDLLEANQKFLANMLKLQNNITNSIANITRNNSSAVTSWTGHIANFLGKGIGMAADHPLLSLGVGAAGAAGIGYLKARSAARTANLLRNMVKAKFTPEQITEELAKRSFLGRIVNAARSGNILSGLGNGIRSASGSLLRGASFLRNASSLSRLASIGRFGLGAAAGIGGVALGVGSVGIGTGKLTGVNYSSLWSAHKANETEAQRRELDRNRWRSYGSILGTGIGGGLGAFFGGGVGAIPGAAAGSAALGYAGGWLYDALHPTKSPDTNNISDQLKPDNQQNQNTQTTPKSDPLSDIITQLRNLNDNVSSNSMNQDKSLSDIVTRLDDLNRIVKNNGNRIQ